MRSVVKCKKGDLRKGWGCAAAPLGCAGSVAAEFALVTPMLVLIAAGIADFGMLATRSAALVATTRIGAEYARSHPVDTMGIQNSMQNAMGFAPALTYPASFPHSCECNDGTPIACTESCAAVSRPGPNRSFIKISASQAFTPMVPWPGIPASVTAVTEVQLR
jgi:Flp pilus assembly protein TadG